MKYLNYKKERNMHWHKAYYIVKILDYVQVTVCDIKMSAAMNATTTITLK